MATTLRGELMSTKTNGNGTTGSALVDRLREELELKFDAKADALADAVLKSISEKQPLELRVMSYPHAARLQYSAANEAAENATKIARRMNRIERSLRKQLYIAETDGTLDALISGASKLGKIDNGKRDLLMAELLDAHEEYNTLQTMYDECSSAKADFNLNGDELRREYYPLREMLYAELKQGEGGRP